MDGYLQNNNYSKIAAENRWINPTLKVHPTNLPGIFYGGIKGKIATPFTFDIGLKYSKAEDQYFFVTRVENRSGNINPSLADLTYNNAFEVVYDNLNTLDFYGNLTYTAPGLFLLLSGHFYGYEVSSLENAPYMPDFTLNAVSRFTLTDKLSAMAEFFLTGPRNIMLQYYLPPVSSALPPPPVYLKADAMAELNIGANYLFAKDLELFGKIENLLNRKDEPWYGYTVQGIRFKVGVSFSF
jgi:outer membrane receptor protein involved in Fe transport